MDSNLLSESLMNVAISTDIATQDELTNVSSDLKGIVDKVSAEAHSANSNLSAYLPLSGNKKLVGDITAFNADVYKESQEYKAAISVGANEAQNDYQSEQITSYISQVNINLDMPLNVLLTSEMSVLYINNINETWSKVEYYDSISGTTVAKSAEYNRFQYYWEVYNHYWDGSSGYITLTALNDGSSDPDRGSLFGYGRRLEISYQYGSFYVDYSIAVNEDELTGGSYSARLQGSYGENDQYLTLTSDYAYITPSYLTQSGRVWFEDLWTCDFTVISGTSNELPYALNECSNRRIFFTDYVDSDTYGWLGNLGDYFSEDYTSINSYELSHFSIDEGHVFTKRSSSSGSTYDYVSEEFDSPLKNIAFSLYNNGTDYVVSELKVGLNEEYGDALYTFNNEVPTQLTTLFVHSMEKYTTKDDVENSLELVSSKISDVSASLDSTNASLATTNRNLATTNSNLATTNANLATTNTTVATNANKAKDTFYGTSNSATSVLTASMADWSNAANSLKTGGIYYVTLQNNDISGVIPSTLNINSSGAKGIIDQYNNSITRRILHSNETRAFLYNGTNYVLLDTFSVPLTGGTISGNLTIYNPNLSSKSFELRYSPRTGGYVLIGNGAKVPNLNGSGVALGISASVGGARAIAIGNNAHATTHGIAIGAGSSNYTNAANDGSIAIGYATSATANDAIQLGTGINDETSSFQVLSYKVLDGNGNVPYERLSSVLTDVGYVVSSDVQSIVDDELSSYIPLSGTTLYTWDDIEKVSHINDIVLNTVDTAAVPNNTGAIVFKGVRSGGPMDLRKLYPVIKLSGDTSEVAAPRIEFSDGTQIYSTYQFASSELSSKLSSVSSNLDDLSSTTIQKTAIINALSDITTANLSGIDYNNPTQDSLSVLYHNVGILQNALSNVLTVVS